MKRSALSLLFAVLCLLPSLPLAGQSSEDGLSALYRGRTATLYPYKFNGTYFWEATGFQTGEVFYNGKRYGPVLLNIDALQQELLVRSSEQTAPVTVFREQLAWFRIGQTRYLNLRYLGFAEAPPGFFELVRDGDNAILRQIRKIHTATPGSYNGKGIGYFDPAYDESIPNCFLRVEEYYGLQAGQIVRLGKKALKKQMAEAPKGGSILDGRPRWHPAEGDAVEGSLDPRPDSERALQLPPGFFSEADTARSRQQGKTLTATYHNKTYVIGHRSERKMASVHGTVYDDLSGKPMPGVVVQEGNGGTYTQTDQRGRYRLSLPIGENTLKFSEDSKESVLLNVQIEGDGALDVTLPEQIHLLKESIVSAQSMAQHRNIRMGIEEVSVQTVNKIPSAFGEGDILKAVLTLPGIKTVGEASGGFNVRGGSADQNLILFNENTIYNPSHLFGIFSSFHPDVVGDIELFKSSIPAEYGGRVSSVLSVHSKDGHFDQWKGRIGLGLLTSRLELDGPLKKDKTSLLLGARTTYSDWLLRTLPKDSHYTGGHAGFSDVNLGLTHKLNAQNTLQAFAYFAQDRFNFSAQDTSFYYRNLNASLSWKHKAANGRHFSLSVGYDYFMNRVEDHGWAYGAYDLETRIHQSFAKAQFQRPLSPAHQLSYGGQLVGYALDPGIQHPYGEASYRQERKLEREYALEPSAFVSDRWLISEVLALEAGLRLSGFYAGKDSRFYGGPEGRLSLKYSPKNNLSFKAGLNSLRQYIHLISNTSAISPTDTWKLSDGDIRPTDGYQLAGGVYWTSLGSGLDFSAEIYGKQTSHHLDYKPGAQLSMNPNLADDLIPVYGRAYGIELSIKKTSGKWLTGWISYSYSRSLLKEMKDHGAESLASGHWYNAPYDKPHEVKLVANLALTRRYSFSFNLDYSTGRPVTIPIGQYIYMGSSQLAYSERNSYRIPDYFRMDAAFNIDPGHKITSLLHWTLNLGVYNLAGRKNPYSVFFQPDSSGKIRGYMISVFATQIPYINLNLLF